MSKQKRLTEAYVKLIHHFESKANEHKETLSNLDAQFIHKVLKKAVGL